VTPHVWVCVANPSLQFERDLGVHCCPIGGGLLNCPADLGYGCRDATISEAPPVRKLATHTGHSLPKPSVLRVDALLSGNSVSSCDHLRV
jgi:hypothetical protein